MAAASRDHEEQEQIRAMHALIDRFELEGQIRWLGIHLEKNLSGEMYRFIADLGGSSSSRRCSRPSA